LFRKSRLHPDVDIDWFTRADTHDLALLQYAQQLDLEHQWQVGNLVQQEGAPIRCLEPTWPRRSRAGKSSALVAEQLALDQVLGKRAALNRHSFALGIELFEVAGRQI
jgi:hypothetical protein